MQQLLMNIAAGRWVTNIASSNAAAAAAAAAAAVGARLVLSSQPLVQPRSRRSLSSQSHSQCLYGVLGVPPTATIEQLKEAFRAVGHVLLAPNRPFKLCILVQTFWWLQRAKALHPDAQTTPGRGAAAEDAAAAAASFVDLVTAHKVLSDPRTRELYDLSRAAAGSRVLRAAAASGVRGAAAAAGGPGGYDDIEVRREAGRPLVASIHARRDGEIRTFHSWPVCHAWCCRWTCLGAWASC